LLLARSYARNRSGLLLCTALCFGLLALNNALLVVDRVVWVAVDLRIWRQLSSLAAVSVLLYGFIWDAD
jgi:hypothetical protein